MTEILLIRTREGRQIKGSYSNRESEEGRASVGVNFFPFLLFFVLYGSVCPWCQKTKNYTPSQDEEKGEV